MFFVVIGIQIFYEANYIYQAQTFIQQCWKFIC